MTRRIRPLQFVGGWMRIIGSGGGNGENWVVRRSHPGRIGTGFNARITGVYFPRRSDLVLPLKFFAPKSGLNAISIKAFGEILAPKRVYLGDESAKKR